MCTFGRPQEAPIECEEHPANDGTCTFYGYRNACHDRPLPILCRIYINESGDYASAAMLKAGLEKKNIISIPELIYREIAH
jgi:hypothetical protein